VAEPQRLSKTYSGARNARILAAMLCWLVALALTAKAQEPTYSAESLIATFEKGSRISLKGTEVFVRDVVAETRLSRVIFKTSQSDQVICELGPPAMAAQHDKQAAVGSELRVKGRVRGRGLLGNVTLDDCDVAPIDVAPIDESTAVPYTVPQELAIAEPDVISETEETQPPASVPDRPPSISKQFATPPDAPRRTLVPGPVEQAPSVPAPDDHSEISSRPSSDSQRPVPYGFYALLVLSGAIGSLILSKLLIPAMRVSRPPVHENTPEGRQAALQALLLKNEKNGKFRV
jgi:hypothetical protein